MSKKSTVIGAEVHVEVDNLGFGETSEKDWNRWAEDVARDIRRHVDGITSAWPRLQYEHECEFCGGYWTERNEDYNGGCCEEDENAHIAAEIQQETLANLDNQRGIG